MKLQRLIIHNIASIEDAEINFQNEPLSNSDVFLITGKTGAGKSTILDSICLALFATTPRFANSQMQGNCYDTNNSRNEPSIKIKDPRQLLRKNTTEASVSLFFTGSNKINYHAFWAVARSRKKIDGKLQDKQWQLTNLETNFTFSKDKEIEKEINRAIGLDFTQFCRTTMLAQGEFTKFLNSEDKEKADILEKITGVNIYSRIGMKIFQTKREKDYALEIAKNNIKSINILSPDECAQKEQSINNLHTQIEQIKKNRDDVQKKLNWINENDNLHSQILELEKNYNAISQDINHDTFKNEEKIILNWNATSEIRQCYVVIQDKIQEKNNLSHTLLDYKKTFIEYKSSELFKVNYLKQQQQELKKISDFLSSESAKLEIYKTSQSIINQLKTIINNKQKIDELKDLNDKKTTHIDINLTPQKGKNEEKRKSIEEQIKIINTDIDTAKNKLEKIQLTPKRKEKEDNLKLINKIEIILEKNKSIEKERKDIEESDKQLAESQQNIEKLKKQKEELEKQEKECEIRYKTCQDLYNKQQSSIEAWAKNIRQKLTIGDVCPICMKKIETELPHEEAIEQLFKPTEEALNKAKEEFEKLRHDIIECDANLKTSNNLQGTIEKKIKYYKESLEKLNNETLELCKEFNIQIIDSQLSEKLNTQKNILDKQNAKLSDIISNGEQIEKDLEKYRTQLQTSQQKLDTIKEECEKLNSEINTFKNEITTNATIINEKQNEIAEIESKLSQTLNATDWDTSWKDDTQKFIEELDKRSKYYDSQNTQLQKIQIECDNLELQKKNEFDTFKAIIKEMPEWASLETAMGQNDDEILRKLNELHSIIINIKTQISTCDKTIAEEQKKLDKFLSDNTNIDLEQIKNLLQIDKKKIDEIIRSHQETQEKLTSAKTLFEEAQRRYKEMQSQKPQLANNETIEILKNIIEELDKDITQMNEQCGVIQQQIKQNEQNTNLAKQQLSEIEKLNNEVAKWNRLNEYFGDATGGKFKKIAQSYVLEGLIHTANKYLALFSDRYKLTVIPGTFVIMVCDAYQGYVERAASTISGGESFIVSLSLALALSDIGQQLAVDTLFIDEGFGTLSGEHLYKAIETLRSLHSRSGRHVGIISHVEELKDQIPIQIRVEPAANKSSSKISIVG